MIQEDGHLFDHPIEENSSYDARKLHEVCLNHCLANHLKAEILPILNTKDQMFIDIEFNREGINFKTTTIKGQERLVRPDIIIHNRKTGPAKHNLLVAECKKEDASRTEIDEDFEKICSLMQDPKYQYSFGLQVLYGRENIRSALFSWNGDKIEVEAINCP